MADSHKKARSSHLLGSPQLEFAEELLSPAYPELRIRVPGRPDTPFDPPRLARSITRAARHADALNADVALSLAKAVGTYLRRNAHGIPLPVDRIRYATRRVLEEMGYPATAHNYDLMIGGEKPVYSLAGELYAYPKEWDDIDMLLQDWLRTVAPKLEAQRVIRRLRRQIEGAGLEQVSEGLLREWLALFLADLDPRAGSLLQDVRLTPIYLRALLTGQPAEGVACPPDPLSAANEITQSVTEQFVFGHVFSPKVTTAYRTETLRIPGLDRPGCPYAVCATLEEIKAAGVLTPEPGRETSIPRGAGTLLRLMGEQNDILVRYVSKRLDWYGLNYSLAPWASQADPAYLGDLARTLLYEFLRRVERRENPGIEVKLHFHWDPPESLVTGIRTPDGNIVSAEDVVESARIIFSELLSIYADLGRRGQRLNLPQICLHLSPYFFGAPEGQGLLKRIGAIALSGAPLTLHYTPAEPLTIQETAQPAIPPATLQCVTVDVAGIARAALQPEHIIEYLDNCLDVAARAHMDRIAFMEPVYRQHEGALSLLSRMHGGRRLVDLDTAQFETSLGGLGDTLDDVLNDAYGRTEVAAQLTEELVNTAHQSSQRWGGALNRQIALTAVIPCGGNGNGCSAPLPDRLMGMSDLHPYFSEDVVCRVELMENEISPEQVGQAIQHAFLSSPCRGIQFA